MPRDPLQFSQEPAAKRHYAFEAYQCPPELGVGLYWFTCVGGIALARASGLLALEPSWGTGSGILAIWCFGMVCADLIRVGESRWLVVGLGLCGWAGSMSLGMALDALARRQTDWALAPLGAFVGGTVLGLLLRFGRRRFHAAVRSRLVEISARIGEVRQALEHFQSRKGHYPETLDELLPDYLQSLPQLPWALGKALAYERYERANEGTYLIGVDIQRGLQAWRFLFVPGLGEEAFVAFWYRTLLEYAYEHRGAKKLTEREGTPSLPH